MPNDTIKNYAEVLSSHPELANDADWQKVHERLSYLVSDEGLKVPNNPFSEYFAKVEDQTFQQILSAEMREKDLRQVNGVFVDANTGQAVSRDDERLKTILQTANDQTKTRMIELKEGVVTNAALGYVKEDPIPAGNILEGGIGGAINEVTSFNLGGIVGGFMSGMGGAVKDFIFNIPVVGKFMSQLNNWVGSNVGAMFSKDKKGLTWEEAGKMADAQRNSKHVANGLAVFSDLNVEAVTQQLEHGLTFGFPEPEPAQTTAPSSPSTATTPEPTPTEPQPTVPTPTEPTPTEPTPTEPQASETEPSTEKKTPAFKPMAQILQDNKIYAEEFSQMLQARSDGPPTGSLPNVQQLQENPNVVVMRLGDDANAPVAFGTQGENGSISEVHVVRDGKVYQYAQTFNGESEFLSSGEFLKDPVAGKESAFFTQVQDVGTVGYDEIAAEITQYVAKEKDLIASR